MKAYTLYLIKEFVSKTKNTLDVAIIDDNDLSFTAINIKNGENKSITVEFIKRMYHLLSGNYLRELRKKDEVKFRRYLKIVKDLNGMMYRTKRIQGNIYSY